MKSPSSSSRRIGMNWRSTVCSLLALATSKSEALATSFYPGVNPRGGETSHSVLKSPANGEWSSLKIKNGVHDPSCVDASLDEVLEANFVAETNLPAELGQFKLRAYRVPQGSNKFAGTEPCVIYSANNPPFSQANGELAKDIPIRVHDQCLTSEVFGSQRCDCKQQLKMALEYISEHGGAIIYLQQEGRGIGLANKIAAYALQDDGLDTVDANLHLGFPEDCRSYGAVPSILKDLQVGSIQLMTNNPRKVDRLTALGVHITDTIPMVVERANPYNLKYLETKEARMKHRNFGTMLSKGPDYSNGALQINGAMQSRRTNGFVNGASLANGIAKQFAHHGEKMATHAVHISLSEDDVNDELEGVVAREDGYCFGRQSVEEAISAIGRGEMVVVVDDMDRENEGDFVMAADMCTPEAMAQIVRYSSGVVCVTMEGKRLDELKLPPMVTNNEDPKGTAFTVTVDGSKEYGVTTGISATDRSITARLLADSKTKPTDIVRPGHIFPLRAQEGGVLTRDGHTEASVDLSRLAGRSPCGVICEIVSEENPTGMARLPELIRFAKKHGYVLTSIADLIQFRKDTEQQ